MSNGPSSHTGFRSEEDKRRFFTIAGILGVAFFVLQFVGPMLAVLVAMPTFFLTGAFTDLEATGAARHRGNIYLVEKTLEMGDEVETSRLVRVEDDAIAGVADLDGWEPMLLGDEEHLWLVGASQVARLVDGSVESVEVREPLGDLCRPFFLNGRLTVVENRPDGGRVMSWTGDGWEAIRPLPQARGRCGFQPVPVGDAIWLFRRDGNTLYVQDASETEPEWRVVLSEPDQWFAFSFAGKPAVASTRRGRGFGVVVYEDGRWQPMGDDDGRGGSGTVGRYDGLSVFPTSDDSLTVVTAGFPGRMTIRDWTRGELGEPRRFGGGFPFPPHMMLVMTLPHLATVLLSLLLAVILSVLMRTHRVTTYEHDGSVVAYASLVRRALAQIADGAIAFLPLSYVFWAMFGTFTDFFERGPDLRLFFAGFAFTVLWSLTVFVIFSFTEGRFGLTPGKWITGIRVVGTDLIPCGFARGLLRNLLKFADGFFNYLVGILLIAFTPEWQRIGDMASRTIVIRKRTDAS